MLSRYAGEFDDWTRWFDLHSTTHIQAGRPEAYAWYQQQTKPIYRWAVDPALPSSVAYPLDRIRDTFGADERDFAGSLSWLMALAILEGFTVIDLFWFTTDDAPHLAQIPSGRYWIGQARGRGIRVTIHGDSGLIAQGPRYGLETT